MNYIRQLINKVKCRLRGEHEYEFESVDKYCQFAVVNIICKKCQSRRFKIFNFIEDKEVTNE